MKVGELSNEEVEALLEAAKDVVDYTKACALSITPRQAPMMAMSILTAATGILAAQMATGDKDRIDIMVRIAAGQIRNAAEGWAEEVLGG